MKKIMLGTSDPWAMSRLSHLPSEPAYILKIIGFLDFWTLTSSGWDLAVRSVSTALGRSLVSNWQYFVVSDKN